MCAAARPLEAPFARIWLLDKCGDLSATTSCGVNRLTSGRAAHLPIDSVAGPVVLSGSDSGNKSSRPAVLGPSMFLVGRVKYIHRFFLMGLLIAAPTELGGRQYLRSVNTLLDEHANSAQTLDAVNLKADGGRGNWGAVVVEKRSFLRHISVGLSTPSSSGTRATRSELVRAA